MFVFYDIYNIQYKLELDTTQSQLILGSSTTFDDKFIYYCYSPYIARPSSALWKSTKTIIPLNYESFNYLHIKINQANKEIAYACTSSFIIDNRFGIIKYNNENLYCLSDTLYTPFQKPKSPIKLLMIGSSFCYYYVEELRKIAEEYGINLIVANLYSSGHTIQQYANEVSAPDKIHQLFITDANGRREITSEKNKYSLEDALTHENWNWDIISLQNYYNNEKINNSAQYNSDAEKAQIVYNYCKQFHPKARYLWNQTWAHDIGFPKWSDYNSLEKQNEAFRNIELCAAAVKNTCDVEIVPSGTAWQYARQNDKITTLHSETITKDLFNITLNAGEEISGKARVLSTQKINDTQQALIKIQIYGEDFSRNVTIDIEENTSIIQPEPGTVIEVSLSSTAGKSYLQYDYNYEWGLCVRLNSSKKHYSDYYHDGDVGDGQYLNACTWFMTLFKISCVGSTWTPSYTLSEDKIKILQQAAYKAVITRS